eukprot:7376378-Prymnesium_polylepis.2
MRLASVSLAVELPAGCAPVLGHRSLAARSGSARVADGSLKGDERRCVSVRHLSVHKVRDCRALGPFKQAAEAREGLQHQELRALRAQR